MKLLWKGVRSVGEMVGLVPVKVRFEMNGEAKEQLKRWEGDVIGDGRKCLDRGEESSEGDGGGVHGRGRDVRREG